MGVARNCTTVIWANNNTESQVEPHLEWIIEVLNQPTSPLVFSVSYAISEQDYTVDYVTRTNVGMWNWGKEKSREEGRCFSFWMVKSYNWPPPSPTLLMLFFSFSPSPPPLIFNYKEFMKAGVRGITLVYYSGSNGAHQRGDMSFSPAFPSSSIPHFALRSPPSFPLFISH